MCSVADARRLVLVALLGGGIWACASRSPTESGAGVLTIPDPYPVELTAGEDGWTARYPDAEGRRGGGKEITAGYEVHVPADVGVALVLSSSDYVYLLSIPKLGLREIAVPGLEFQIELRDVGHGRYEIEGAHLCGDAGAEVPVQLIVEPRSEFCAWLGQ